MARTNRTTAIAEKGSWWPPQHTNHGDIRDEDADDKEEKRGLKMTATVHK
ncbi:MAG TPA: hypothetical protein V6C97_35420 [Oculatellaceae cyanobacterium]